MKNTVFSIFSKAMNAYLNLDPESAQRLQTVAGKSVTVNLQGLNLVLHLIFNEGKVVLQSTLETPANAVITGTPLRLLQLAVTKKNRQQFFAEDVVMTGDLELGQQIIDLFDHLEIDWEEILSHCLGDVPANFLGRLARCVTSWATQARETMVMNVSEYVHEEIPLFPPREALQDFFHDVDVIRMDADRLDARVNLLQQRLAGKQDVP